MVRVAGKDQVVVSPEVYTMQQSLGIYIRQQRRQLNLTQTELGGERYSKSYVSAVERGTILPSRDALQFFAEQLRQSVDQLGTLLQQAQQVQQNYALVSSSLTAVDGDNAYSEVTTLLDLLLEGTNPPGKVLSRQLARLSQEQVLTLPLEQQACYAFLQALAAQENGDFVDALPLLEFALPLAPAKYRPVILYTQGMNYYQAAMFQTSLGYHVRALDRLQAQPMHEMSIDLLVQVELRCGDDCRALGDYHAARKYYEDARRRLQSSHNLKMAAELYLGLGYCTYAAIYQHNPSADVPSQQALFDTHAQFFQRALSYLLQSRTLYQTCQEPSNEVSARLLQTMILLDFSSFRQYNALINFQKDVRQPSFNCEGLLDDAEEQCRQLLMGWQERTLSSTEPSLLAVALTYLARIHGQRATLARLNGYDGTATRERALAAVICQEAFDVSSGRISSWEKLQDVLSPPNITFNSPSLPHLPDAAQLQHLDPFSLSEIYFAAGELAEEQACSATDAGYAGDCYLFANRCFQSSVDAIRHLSSLERRDPGYIVRCYQRYINVLRKRSALVPEQRDDVNTQILALLKDGFAFPLYPYPTVTAAYN
jgi:tetratricopeptide (TPR) repeat protein